MNTQETLDLLKEAQSKPVADELAKGFTQPGTATAGLQAYDLEAPSKKLYPIRTMLRNMIPRIVGGIGIQANYKTIRGINTTNFFGGVGEGQRAAVMNQSQLDKFAAFRALGIENNVTFEADFASKGFEDLKALAVQQSLESLMEAEERQILFGKASGSLGTTPTPTLVASTTGGALAAATWSVACVALTGQGLQFSPVGTLNDVVPTSTFSSPDGSTITQDGGAAQKSAAATVATTGTTGSIAATVAAVPGAMSYAWFLGAASAERLVAITVLNSAVLTATQASTQLLSALPAADKSTNSQVFDGLLTLAFASGSGAYIQKMADGVAGVGTALTPNGNGGIVEFDALIKGMYKADKLCPDMILVSDDVALQINKAVMTSGANGAFRFQFASDQAGVAGSLFVDSYKNPLGSAVGVPVLKIMVHPFMPAGTVLFYSTKLPYPMSGVPSPAVMKLRKDYYQLEWPIRSRKYEYGVYMDGVLQHYAPFSMGVIYNIGG